MLRRLAVVVLCGIIAVLTGRQYEFFWVSGAPHHFILYLVRLSPPKMSLYLISSQTLSRVLGAVPLHVALGLGRLWRPPVPFPPLGTVLARSLGLAMAKPALQGQPRLAIQVHGMCFHGGEALKQKCSREFTATDLVP